MKTRLVTIYTGARILVPQHIQRIDVHGTHGWQLRYRGYTKLFSDSKAIGDGPRHEVSLKEAIAALCQRIADTPAPTGLQLRVSKHKQNKLPVGISGPILRQRPGRSVPECHFSVNLPRFGTNHLRRSVYIANQNTYTPERYNAALNTAINMRKAAEAQYQLEATAAKRREAIKL